MPDQQPEFALAQVATAIAEPARSKMLCALLDGHARTATELSVIAEVSPATTSVHLQKLSQAGLLHLLAQGRHRYYRLANVEVAAALESLLVIATAPVFKPNTPTRLQQARTCYDHLAGVVAVQMHDKMLANGWLVPDGQNYRLSDTGAVHLQQLGVLAPDLSKPKSSRRRFACGCLDWSQRSLHLGGALGAALLTMMQQQQWLSADLDSRAVQITAKGKRQLQRHFAIRLDEDSQNH